MPSDVKTDLIVRVVDFNSPTKDTVPLYIDKESFLNSTLNNQSFMERLKDGKILGLLTHKGRSIADKEKEVPYLDSIITNPDLANIMRDMWYDETDNSVYAAVDLTESFDGGKKSKNMIKDKIPLGVSMSTEAMKIGNKYIISYFNGVDFTTDPLINGSVITSVNFSNSSQNVMKPTNICLSKIFGVREDIVETNMIRNSKPTNFSLVNEMIKEAKKGIRENIRIRFQQVINYIKSNKLNYTEYEDVLKSVIFDPIYNFIAQSMSDQGRINLFINLQLNRYVLDKSELTKINNKLNILKNKISSNNGIMNPRVQNELSHTMNILMTQLWNYVMYKSGAEEL